MAPYLCTVLMLSLLYISHSASLSQHWPEPRVASGDEDSTAAINPSRYNNRLWHASGALQDFLYIDGGAVSFVQDDGVVATLPSNLTYSIDITKSWTNKTVVLNRIPKGGAPIVSSENLWVDRPNNCLYAYNGDVGPSDFSINPPASELWKFQPSGSSGSWQMVTASNYDRVSGASGTFGAGVGYALGGYEDIVTELNGPDPAIAAPGLVTYNSSTQVWSKQSVSGFYSGAISEGTYLQYLPGYGKAGVLIVMGGFSGTEMGSAAQIIQLGTISVFDIATSRWGTQSASGTIPVPRQGGCSVGLQGNNATFEIFLYGGATGDNLNENLPASPEDVALDAVYVLSIPSFNWAKANYPAANARTSHTCNVIGKRQMAVVGGYPSILNSSYVRDIWTLGLGIFDLSEMAWSDRYDANAAAYVTSQVVQDYYSQHGPTPASGWDPLMESLFAPTVTNPTSPSETSAKASHNGGGTNAGVIAGGVVGGLGGILIIAVITWFVLRRHRAKRRSPTTSQDYIKPELYGSLSTPGLQSTVSGYQRSTSGPVEASTAGQIHEKCGTPRTEMQGSRRHEMP